MFFFFFKQKTAYEMRISDWSSDVCSSDLREFATPLPNDAKRSVLSRYGYPQETWVETGTYLGETTAFLSKNSNKVITIEPSEELFSKAANRIKSSPNVEVLPGGSDRKSTRLNSSH